MWELRIHCLSQLFVYYLLQWLRDKLKLYPLYTEALLQEDRHYTEHSAWAVLLRDNADPLIECFGGCQSANRSFGVIRRWIEQAAFSLSPLCFQKKKKGKLLRDKQQQLCAVTLWWKDTWQKVLIAVGILDWFFSFSQILFSSFIDCQWSNDLCLIYCRKDFYWAAHWSLYHFT